MIDIIRKSKILYEEIGNIIGYQGRVIFLKLIAELEKSREAVETLSKQANGMIIVDDSKRIDSLTLEVAELKSLATTQKSIELTGIIKAHVDHGEKQLKEINSLKSRVDDLENRVLSFGGDLE